MNNLNKIINETINRYLFEDYETFKKKYSQRALNKMIYSTNEDDIFNGFKDTLSKSDIDAIKIAKRGNEKNGITKELKQIAGLPKRQPRIKWTKETAIEYLNSLIEKDEDGNYVGGLSNRTDLIYNYWSNGYNVGFSCYKYLLSHYPKELDKLLPNKSKHIGYRKLSEEEIIQYYITPARKYLSRYDALRDPNGHYFAKKLYSFLWRNPEEKEFFIKQLGNLWFEKYYINNLINDLKQVLIYNYDNFYEAVDDPKSNVAENAKRIFIVYYMRDDSYKELIKSFLGKDWFNNPINNNKSELREIKHKRLKKLCWK